MIKIKKANKYFNRFKKNQIHVIDETSLELDEGLIALLGESGSGKTTLLNVIGGLDKIDQGEIYIDDKRFSGLSKNKIDEIRNASIGYIFQNYLLLDDMTVFENVALPLRMNGLKDEEEIKKRVESILEKLGLYKYRKRLASMLSGGERQRVGIARAIIKNPSIIIADEPTGNLDSKNSLEIMNIIKSISNEKLVVLVTHEKDLAYFYADRIINIEDGKVINDFINSEEGTLDYRIDNKIYLKDLKESKKISNKNLFVNYYGDELKDINIKIVVKGDNIYIQSDKDFNVVDSDSNIELIDDNYREIDKDTYKDYEFENDYVIKNKYKSIYNIFSLIKNGFKKVLSYSVIKKILLLGFFVAAMFVSLSISMIFGANKVNEEDFIKEDRNYLSIFDGDSTYKEYIDLMGNENIEYVIPGDSIVSIGFGFHKFVQTKNNRLYENVSLAPLFEVKEVIIGRMPEDNSEVIIDKMMLDILKDTSEAKSTGLFNDIDFIGVSLYNANQEFTIVGIADLGNPSIYMDKDLIIITKVLSSANMNDKYLYEEDMGITRDEDYIVDDEVIKDFINNTNDFVIYPSDKEKFIESVIDKKVNNIYDIDKEEYILSKKKAVRTTIILSFIVLAIALIEIFLMIRASFLSRVKEIGILRAIGLKKKDIYKSFLGEILAITIAASIPGLVFMSYILYKLSKVALLSNYFEINIFIFTVSLLSIVIFNITVGLLPMSSLLKKTPAEILARNDIN